MMTARARVPLWLVSTLWIHCVDAQCKTFQAGLCDGPTDCMCTMGDACAAPVVEAVSRETAAAPSVGSCPGQCRKVVHNQCSGPSSCLLDIGPCDGPGCPSSTVVTVGGVAVKRLKDDASGFFWSNGLECDADGAPNAYNPQDTGLDYLANAGDPGHWWGIATDAAGTPYTQGTYPSGSYSPYPGYYVSTTSLEDAHFPTYDVRRYANAVNLSFVVLPTGSFMSLFGAKLGDACFVYNGANNRSSFALVADTGPSTQIGEGSVALHLALGHDPINAHGRVASGIPSGVHTLCFAGSSTGPVSTQDEVDTHGVALFDAWGGMSRFQKCIL